MIAKIGLTFALALWYMFAMIPRKAGHAFTLCALLVLWASESRLWADSVTLQPVADATLFEASPDNNLGDSNTFMAGLRPKGGRSRGVLRFDLTRLPANIVINSASLTLTVTVTPPIATRPASSFFDLHRVTQAWGEGNKSSYYGGVAASPGEATWNSAMASIAPWRSPGGDFLSAVSASQLITGDGLYTFNSTPSLTSDVQSWYGNPANNFGWILMSESEGVSRTVRRFGSREDLLNAPSLVVNFTAVPEPGTLTLLGLGCVCVLGWNCHRSRRAR